MARKETVDHYGSSYGNFATELFERIRSEVFGDDIGQNGWLTAPEQDRFIRWLDLADSSHLLDIACGSGGPTLRIARKAGCRVHGIDVHEQAVQAARDQASAQGLVDRATFECVDAGKALPFTDRTFDGIICIDAVNHLPDRARVFREWSRILKPGGRLVFTDPITVTGALTHEEIEIRSSIGFFLYVPRGLDEKLLADAGFEIVEVDDRTENMAEMAERWHRAREVCAADLEKVEGRDAFEGQQTFFRVASRLARERRLSRFAFLARKK